MSTFTPFEANFTHAMIRWSASIGVVIVAAACGSQPAPPATPLPAAGLRVIQLSAGVGTTCVRLSDDTVKCWGNNRHHEVDDSAVAFYPNAQRVGFGGRVDAVFAGSNYLCAILSTGAVSCRGLVPSHLQPDGQVRSRNGSLLLALSPHATMLSPGSDSVCALLDKQVSCWGLGISAVDPPTPPLDVLQLGKDVLALSVGGWGQHLAVLTDGTVQSWWANDVSIDGGNAHYATIPLDRPAKEVVGGLSHACALLVDGTVTCWGSNSFGELGRGVETDTHASFPQAVVPLSGKAIALSSGAFHTCALLSEGQIECWGMNAWHELGVGDAVDRKVPTRVAIGGAATAVSAGEHYTCALLVSGIVRCWGANDSGELGDGTTQNRPTAVTSASVP